MTKMRIAGLVLAAWPRGGMEDQAWRISEEDGILQIQLTLHEERDW